MEAIHTKIIVWVAVAAFVGALYVSGQEISWEWIKALTYPTLAVGVCFWLFDNWLWKFRWLHGWLVKRPNISGTWAVEIESTWIDTETGKPARRNGIIEVRQTYTQVTFSVETDESVGSLIGSELIRLPQSKYRFCGSYMNEPKPAFRDRSVMHYGTFLLSIDGPSYKPEALSGSYWTDRKTTGSMKAQR